MLGLDPSDRLRLAAAADREIATALAGQAGTLPPSSKTEALGILLSDALPAVADRWAPILAALGIAPKIFAAFTFSAPVAQVRTGDGVTRFRELGDVLIIVDDLTGPRYDRRAVLVEANLGVEPGDHASKADGWLEADAVFRIADMPASARDRSLHDPAAPGSAGAGTARAAIDLTRAAINVAGSDAAGRLSLGQALVAIASGEAGREAVGGGADDWSATVDDVLRATLGATSSGLARRGGPTRTITRHAGACGTGFVVFDLRRPISSEGAEAQPRGDGPLSIVHIVFSPESEAQTQVRSHTQQRPH